MSNNKACKAGTGTCSAEVTLTLKIRDFESAAKIMRLARKLGVEVSSSSAAESPGPDPEPPPGPDQ